jgi:carbamoyl-phosphate synthase large subunit
MSCRRLLIMGAGTAAAENFIRSFRDGDPSLVLLGCHDDRFVLKQSGADARHLLPSPRAPHFLRALRALVQAVGVDLVIPTSDVHVQRLSVGRRYLPAKTFLPAPAVVSLCRDKYALIIALRRRGISAPETHPVTGRKAVDRIFAHLGGRAPLWCRPRTGTCARGGAAVSSPEQAWRWIRLWETMQGVPATSFTLAEYLPGREILCQSVWRSGRMLLASTFERLSYFGVDNIPSGVTSLSSLAKTVVEPDVVALCRQAIRAVNPKASGAFAIDVKGDGQGRPHVTEINAGRFFMAMTAFDRVLKHNMAVTYVQAALGDRVDLCDEYDAADGYYMVRDLDMLPGIVHADDLLEGVESAWAEPIASSRLKP